MHIDIGGLRIGFETAKRHVDEAQKKSATGLQWLDVYWWLDHGCHTTSPAIRPAAYRCRELASFFGTRCNPNNG